MSFAPLALPSLANVPGAYTISSGESFAYPLAMSLLESGVIAAEDVARRPRSEMAVATAALTRHWNRITEGMHMFDWNLRLEQEPAGYPFEPAKRTDQLWAMIQTTRGPVSCKQVCIGGAITELERVREGLGQTLLAALYDAFHMLPTVCSPEYTFWLAQHTYWYGESDEKYAVEEAMAMHDCKSREELVDTFDFFTHEKFFAEMPKWAARPERVLSRHQVRRAAARDDFAREVVGAMDSIWNIVQFYGPFAEVGTGGAGLDAIDLALVVRWQEEDVCGRVIDDFLQYVADSEELLLASSVTSLKVDGGDIATWLKQMEATAMLAKAVEYLLNMLGRDEFQTKTLVRVFA
ncbi:PRTRC system protein F [Paraburkholderia sp. BL21I4N1]|uniref:PRTRC system protein F n=1 Tax=Paraburkholderia sp. BL21I4N1 TaxID=1938801 RepID=UPI000CFBC74F|nr:PRTRC system protein F [Paraburkholderia sp. BL21I4N1]PQV51012.1 PRTRC genetic system protein F [Paraburkholderia sp. BL21I4N1]